MNELQQLMKLIEDIIKQHGELTKTVKKITDNEEKMLEYTAMLEARIKALELANKN